MIDFQKMTFADKARYEQILFSVPERSCEYSFANQLMWGKQQAAFRHDCVLFFSHFYGRSIYPYPIGNGDKTAVIREILEDARERGIPCRFTGMCERDHQELEELFPGQFHFHYNRDSFDYVYDINALADLRGKKLQKKRNHLNRFCQNHPDYRIEPIDSTNIDRAMEMVQQWYHTRMESNPDGDYLLESIALRRAFRDFDAMGMEGIILLDGGEVLAVTMGSRLSEQTFDIHFEKAREDVDGAYTAINCEFARYLRLKHPEVLYLNREDDMGLEGLRKAKLSYHPHHLQEKCWGLVREDIYAD